MTKTMLSIGSVSHGTMRSEDLISTFTYVLGQLDKARLTAFEAEWADLLNSEEDDDLEGASECVDALFDILGEYVPDYCYFGANEGDGSDYGCWVSWDSIDDDVQSGTIVKVPAGDAWPELDADVEYVLEVTDHGNGSLFSVARGERSEPIWECV